jgi:hypothetical protein
LTILLAAGLTTTGVVFGVGSGTLHDGPIASARGVLRKLFQPGPHSAPPLSIPLVPPPEDNTAITEAGYPGVVLRPDVKPETTLVAPPPTSLRQPGPPTAALPVTIPFAGEYWMFRAPNAQPPRRSYFRHATPLALSFTSLNHVVLRMEAHQRLEHAIDLSCCGTIQIAISNADRYPGSVMLELVLADVTTETSRSLVLGTAEVASWPHSGGFAAIEPVPEVLNFTVPSHSSLSRFNDIAVLFHFSQVRDDRSARIAIDRFVLVPRS